MYILYQLADPLTVNNSQEYFQMISSLHSQDDAEKHLKFNSSWNLDFIKHFMDDNSDAYFVISINVKLLQVI